MSSQDATIEFNRISGSAAYLFASCGGTFHGSIQIALHLMRSPQGTIAHCSLSSLLKRTGFSLLDQMHWPGHQHWISHRHWLGDRLQTLVQISPYRTMGCLHLDDLQLGCLLPNFERITAARTSFTGFSTTGFGIASQGIRVSNRVLRVSIDGGDRHPRSGIIGWIHQFLQPVPIMT